jgi:transcriptional antiterminator NusG
MAENEKTEEAGPVPPPDVNVEPPVPVTTIEPVHAEPPSLTTAALATEPDAAEPVEHLDHLALIAAAATIAEEPAAEEPAATPPESAVLATAEAAEPVAEVPASEGAPTEEVPAAPPSKKRWYVVKVQSGREDSIKEAIERRVRIEALEEFFGQIVIPVETVTEVRNNRKVTKHHKLYPGYLMAEVEYNDRILYLFRETSGVGDFVGGTVTRPPMPMSTNEVEKMLGIQSRTKPTIKPKIPKFAIGDRLRVKKGTFAGMEGDLVKMMEEEAKVELTLTIFGRGVAVQIDYWDVEPV